MKSKSDYLNILQVKYITNVRVRKKLGLKKTKLAFEILLKFKLKIFI